MPAQPGHIFRVFVNGVAYKSNRVRYKGTMNPVDLSNSEGEPGDDINGVGVPGAGEVEWLDFPWESVCENISTNEFEIQNASYDPDENRFDAPAGLKIGARCALEIQPIRATGIGSYRIPSCLIIDMDHDMQLRDAQPITFRVRTDGRFLRPGEVLG